MMTELKPPKSNFSTSHDGKRLVAVYGVDGSNQVCAVVCDTDSGMEITKVGNYVAYVTFSPQGTFIQTWSRFQEKEQITDSPDSPGCVTIWKTFDGKRVASFDAKNFRLDNWPCVQWTSDESLAIRTTPNQVLVYGGHELNQSPIKKIAINDLKNFAVSPVSNPCYVASFVPPKGNRPARIEVYKLSESSPVLAKSMFRADSCQFLWNKNGTALMCWITSDSDSSGKSYYGESFLYYGCPKKGKELKQVDLPRKGPIQDVSWSPDGEQFIIVYGSMPARATLFNWLCEPLFDFGTGTRNTISFSPHGRFLCLGGFGNLPGDLEFWDIRERKLLGRASAPCTTSFMWSPDSQYFLAATTFPRLRVDNGFKIFRYQGTLVGSFPIQDELYQIEFLYRDPTGYPDRPASPSTRTATSQPFETVNTQSNNAQNNIYRPPALRGKKPSVTLHEEEAPRPLDAKTWLRETKQSQDKFVAPIRKTVVGIPSDEEEETLSKSQNRNRRKKKAAQKKKREIEEQANEKGFELKEELPASVKQLMKREPPNKVDKEKGRRENKVVDKIAQKTANLSME
ncbi:eukaryotic translation initiation factor-related protein [Galdieria sulphuraria]|uniref:Eukaryotic translation initiation factor 2A n=1 Tax=Galdieria sulphuraria TaxID=130081 RepID=M2XFQ3_GALSU|nr:eukaryotic translation initiation factor-related protein [Galdieria sulphuraria]EME28837.1 eukaryotic translation initiation factor-related protein [Galdieria sulphuraria]|eukprot:XP_005705357.1 eukaryotic translation initiation factor-related protein [Galdieria sulphuraria]